MLYTFILGIHITACVLMILVVLLQAGRGAGLIGMGGGGGDSLINTPSGSSFMKKVTAVMAGTFAFTSLFLTLLGTRSGMSSVTGRVREEAPAAAPQAPAPAAPKAPAAPVIPKIPANAPAKTK
ncbi:MAG: preprotein translocase subunit SecG [Elusimicrobiota bacterium]